jgi:hypothetical protein
MATKDNTSQLPCDENTKRDWLVEVENWPWEVIEDSKNRKIWKKEGKCPRCDHDMSRIVGKILGPHFESLLIEESETYKTVLKEVDIWCNCTVLHPGCSESKGGCGQMGIISPPKV